MKIVLLDLNATLVENTEVHNLPYQYNIPLERYRSWLIELLRPHHVIIMTARPVRYKAETLERIRLLEKWTPMAAHFKPNDSIERAAAAKYRMLNELVFPEFGKPSSGLYIALESNCTTKSMYMAERIPTYRQEDVFRSPEILTSST